MAVVAQIGNGGSIQAVLASSASPPSSLSGLTSYCVETWSLAASNDVQDVTDTCSGGTRTRIKGVSSWTLTATCFFDNAAPQYTDINVGSIIDAYLNIGAADALNLPALVAHKIRGRFIISEFTIENPATTSVKFSFTALSTGAVVAVN